MTTTPNDFIVGLLLGFASGCLAATVVALIALERTHRRHAREFRRLEIGTRALLASVRPAPPVAPIDPRAYQTLQEAPGCSEVGCPGAETAQMPVIRSARLL